jgi:hypothetical protein
VGSLLSFCSVFSVLSAFSIFSIGSLGGWRNFLKYPGRKVKVVR